jgi:hypothetical protein
LNSDQNNPSDSIFPEYFPGNKKIHGVIPAACLILMTMASVSLYSVQADFTLPILTLAVLITFSLIMISRRGGSS